MSFLNLLNARPGLHPFSPHPKMGRVVGLVELLLSNFCGYDNSIVAGRTCGNHLSLLQVLMCFLRPIVDVELLVDRI
jgi:predicted DNA-binding helix-hairpin-helix protein